LCCTTSTDASRRRSGSDASGDFRSIERSRFPVRALEGIRQRTLRITEQRLDLDHVGTKITEHPVAVRAGKPVRELGDADPAQWVLERLRGFRDRQTGRRPSLLPDRRTVLIQCRSWPADAERARGLQLHRRPNHLYTAELGIVDLLDEPNKADVIVVKHLAGSLHRQRSDIEFPEASQPLFTRPRLEHVGNPGAHDGDVVVRQQRRPFGRRIGRRRYLTLKPERLHGAPETTGGARMDLNQLTVAALVHGKQEPLVPEIESAGARLRLDEREVPLAPPVHGHLREHPVAHGGVDLVALTGDNPRPQRGQDPDGGHHAGAVAESRVPLKDGALAGSTPLSHDAESCCHGGVVTGKIAPRPRLTVRGDCAVHQVRSRGAQLSGPEPDGVDPARRPIVKYHVRFDRQPSQQAPVVVRVVVHLDAPLVAIPDSSRSAPRRVAPATLRLDDVAAVIGEKHRCDDARHAPAQVEHAHTVKRLCGHVVYLPRSVCTVAQFYTPVNYWTVGSPGILR